MGASSGHITNVKQSILDFQYLWTQVMASLHKVRFHIKLVFFWNGIIFSLKRTSLMWIRTFKWAPHVMTLSNGSSEKFKTYSSLSTSSPSSSALPSSSTSPSFFASAISLNALTLCRRKSIARSRSRCSSWGRFDP